jgi:UDP-glucose 4-epimerase
MRQNFKVTGVSRMATPPPTSIPRSRLEDGPNPGENDRYDKMTIINCDISHDESRLLKAIQTLEEPIDCVFHLAGQTFKKDSPDPQLYFHDNFLGTLNILEVCRKLGIKKFVFSSSIAVYGIAPGQYDASHLPVDESHTIRPYDFYDLSKWHAEQLCEFYSRRFVMDCIVLRYSRIYGPGTQKAIVFNAIRKAIYNSSIEVLGDISTDFVYVDDVVKANILALQISGFEVFNIGGGQESTLDGVCRKIIMLTNSGSEINYRSEPKSRFSLDVSKARSMLGYSPVALEEGLERTITYIKEREEEKEKEEKQKEIEVGKI